MGVMENPPSLYFSPTEKRDFEDMEQAVQYATENGGQIVRERAEAAGAESIQIVVDRDEMRASMGSEWGGDVLLECRLTITAIGKPRQFHEVAR